MNERYTDFLLTCREEANISRNVIAGKTRKSMESIGANERGETLAPPDVLQIMESEYQIKMLAMEYIRLTHPIVREAFPKSFTRKGNQLELVVSLVVAAKSVEENTKNILNGALTGGLMDESVQRLLTSAIDLLPQIIQGVAA